MRFVPKWALIAAPLNKKPNNEEPTTFGTLEETRGIRLTNGTRQAYVTTGFGAYASPGLLYDRYRRMGQTDRLCPAATTFEWRRHTSGLLVTIFSCRGTHLQHYVPGIFSLRVGRPVIATILGRFTLHCSNRPQRTQVYMQSGGRIRKTRQMAAQAF